MKTVYISGPMDGQPNKNRVEFKLAESYYRDLGYNVINPLDIAENLDLCNSESGQPAPDYCDYLLTDIAVMLDADMVVVLKGYQTSFGCGLEIAFATKKGIPVYEAFTDKPLKLETKVCTVRVYEKLVANGRIGEVLETAKNDMNYV